MSHRIDCHLGPTVSSGMRIHSGGLGAVVPPMASVIEAMSNPSPYPKEDGGGHQCIEAVAKQPSPGV